MVFGRGVNIGRLPELGGSYDGTTELDTLSRLSIVFLDGFEPTPVSSRRIKKATPSACPAMTKELATDLIRYLFAYYSLMPVQRFPLWDRFPEYGSGQKEIFL
jgi:hypothetical protein